MARPRKEAPSFWHQCELYEKKKARLEEEMAKLESETSEDVLRFVKQKCKSVVEAPAEVKSEVKTPEPKPATTAATKPNGKPNGIHATS